MRTTLEKKLIKEFNAQFREGMWTGEAYDIIVELVEEGVLTFEGYEEHKVIETLERINKKVFEGKNEPKEKVDWNKLESD